MMPNGVLASEEHMNPKISKKTQDKAIKLGKVAESLSINPGYIRFNNEDDFMSYWFTNGTIYLIVFCTPSCYLAEIYTKDKEAPTEYSAEYSAVKNIRNFLLYIRKSNLISFDSYFNNLDIHDVETLREFLDN